MQLDSVIIQKTRKVVGARKIKSALKIRHISNDLTRIFIRTAVA